ncbi:MAG: phosphoserine phosphatase RsbU/P [Candidatus Cloacimonadota bacterium]|jgi:sigma-B regulation protein RsbU (phosphoserine phosphatase)|nr:phosphoserine phosphatase RsbU/P [Candidatus Cloacimonadota bacterium]
MEKLFNDPIKKKILILVIILFFATVGIIATRYIFASVAYDYDYDIGIQISCRNAGQIIFRRVANIKKDFKIMLKSDTQAELAKLQTSIKEQFQGIDKLLRIMESGGEYEDRIFANEGIQEFSQKMYFRQEVAEHFQDLAPDLATKIEQIRKIVEEAENQLDDSKNESLSVASDYDKYLTQFEEKFTEILEINKAIFTITDYKIKEIEKNKKDAIHQLRIIRYVMVFIIGIVALVLFIRTFKQISLIIEDRKKTGKELAKLNKSLIQELEIAENVQSYLLPNWLMLEHNIIFSSTYTPSKKVGGDLFDMIPVSDNEYVVYVGDISGHGVQAALIMTAVKSTINMIIENEKNNIKPYFIVNRLNKILIRELFPDNYMTLLLCYVDFNNNEIRYFNAGHPPIIQLDTSTNKAYKLDDKGSIPIGWRVEHEYSKAEENVIPFEKDKIYFLYTDGIFECENPQGEQLGIEGLANFITENIDTDNTIIITHKIKKRLKELEYDITPDDFTLIAFQKREQNEEEDKSSLFLMRSLLINTRDIGQQCEQFIEKKTGRHNLAARTELVVNEFLNNIIVHGLRNKSDTIILLQLEIKEENVVLTFWDKGLKWKLPSRQESDFYFAKKNDMDTSGRGVPIIYSLATNIIRTRYDEINETKIEIPINKDI